MNCESPSRTARWPLLRVQPGHDSLVELLSGDWVRLSTHYYKRTFLCPESPSCASCDLLPVRCYWYLPALVLPQRRATLIEFSSAASSDLEQHAKLLSGRIGAGLTIRLSRRGSKSPVRSEVVSDSSVVSQLRFHEWVTALMAIYLLPPIHSDEGLDSYGGRVQRVLEERSRLIAESIQRGGKGRA